MFRYILSSCLLIAGAPLGVHSAETIPEVTVAHPIVRETADYDFIAQVEPPARQPLRSEQDGIVEKVLCKAGQIVQPGDLLFTLAATRLQADLRSAQDDVRKATEQLQRAEGLVQATTNTLDLPSLQAKRDLAKVMLQVAEKNVASLQKDLGDTQIKSPAAGQILEISVKPGDRVTSTAGFATLLGTLTQTDPILVSFQVDERTLLYLRKLASEGGAEKEASAGCPIVLQLPNHEGVEHHGIAHCSDNRLDAQTGRIRFLAEFAKPSQELLAAAQEASVKDRTAHVRMTIGKAQKQILVPTAAIGYDDASRPFVLTVDDKNIVHAKPVKMAVATAQFQALSEGPSAEEWVIIGAVREKNDSQDTTLSPADFTTDIRTLRIKPGTKVSPERVELKSSSTSKATTPRTTAPALK